MSTQNETKLVERIRTEIHDRYADIHGVWDLKTHGDAYQDGGIPDLLVAIDGRLFAFEVKFKDRKSLTDEQMMAKATPRQLARLRRMGRAGIVVGVVWSVEQAFALIDANLNRGAELHV